MAINNFNPNRRSSLPQNHSLKLKMPSGSRSTPVMFKSENSGSRRGLDSPPMLREAFKNLPKAPGIEDPKDPKDHKFKQKLQKESKLKTPFKSGNYMLKG